MSLIALLLVYILSVQSAANSTSQVANDTICIINFLQSQHIFSKIAVKLIQKIERGL
jgi:hypothetical protein